MPIILPIIALCLGHVFSNATRTLPAVAVDLLTRDLGISAEALAQITGAFPFAFAAAMVPVGIALDRYGVKRVSLCLLAVAGGGAAMAALATGPWSMLAAQVVLGAGCSGMLMAPITFAARALSAPRFTLWSGLIQAIGNTGMLLSASPLALLIEATDWRAGFWACVAMAGFAAALVALVVPDDSPSARAPRSPMQDLAEVARIAWAPPMRAVMVIAFPSFAAVLGLRGLWGGPWLMDVKGLDRVAAGNVLSGVTLALIAGPALAGVVLRLVGRPRLLLAGAHLVSGGLVALILAGGPGAALPAALGVPMLPASWDFVLLLLFCLVISLQVITFSLIRAAVPPDQAGRALSAGNMAYFLGAAVLQAASGVAAALGGIEAALATFAVALVAGAVGFWVLSGRGAR